MSSTARRARSRHRFNSNRQELLVGFRKYESEAWSRPAKRVLIGAMMPESFSGCDLAWLRLAVRLAQRGIGATSPNPMVGAVLVKGGKIIGRGWHRRAGEPHAEIEALRDAQRHGASAKGATLYVTLEPCCTHGRTPPCTDAIIAAGIKRVVVGTIDPNPKHSGRAFKILRRAGIAVEEVGVPRSRGKNNTRSPSRLKADSIQNSPPNARG